LKDGTGAEAYKNVDIVFIHGKKAVLTVYDVPEGVAGGEREEGKVGEGWVEKEKIVLSDYNTRVSNIV
jgi:hypothetical protein